jgi:hypothetical protein
VDLMVLVNLLPHSYVGIATAAIALCAAVTAAVPAPGPKKTFVGKVWVAIYGVIDWVALNKGNGETAQAAMAKGKVVPTAPVAGSGGGGSVGQFVVPPEVKTVTIVGSGGGGPTVGSGGGGPTA